VLFLDDNSTSLYIDHEPQFFIPAGASLKTQAICQRILDYFELRWVATAEEAREFRDLSQQCYLVSPSRYQREAWFPEILAFDYALSGAPNSVEKRFGAEGLRRLSPLPDLRDLARSLSVPLPGRLEAPGTGKATNDDNMGCFAGGLIFSLFAGHPTAPVALTVKGSATTENTEAGFFEWMLESDSDGTFKAKGRPHPQWEALLVEGVQSLRKRLSLLIASGLVTVPLQELLPLADGLAVESLHVRSRYGVRNLPVAALFLEEVSSDEAKLVSDLDYGKDDDPERAEQLRIARGEAVKSEAQRWATEVLTTLLQPLADQAGAVLEDGEPVKGEVAASTDLRAGMELAAELWRQYESEALEDRYELSELMAKQQGKALSSAEAKRLTELLQRFDLPPDATPRAKVPATRSFDLRSGKRSDRVKRWAILFVITQLQARLNEAEQEYRHLLEEEDLTPGTRSLFSSELTANDVYLALYPVPSSPLITPFHEQGGSVVSAWPDLKRLGQLRVDVNHVLAGKPWCDQGDEPSYGLFPGERNVLRMFASAMMEDVPSWLRVE
jgi:hypothetical protein